jgi:hypothetical protein
MEKVLNFDETKSTYHNVPAKEKESRAGLKDIEWNRIRNKETKKVAEICLRDVLVHYNVQDEDDLEEREFLDKDIQVIRACLSVIEGLKPMPWQLNLIMNKRNEIKKYKIDKRRSEFQRIQNNFFY